METKGKTATRPPRIAPTCSTSREKPSSSTKCRLVEAFFTFWPAFQRWADAQAQGLNLTPQRTRILALLQERGPVMMGRLKTELGVTATNITALVDALEKDGLVARKPHPEDRRATLVELTPKAACELMRQGCSGFRERVAELFDALPEADRRELLRMIEALRGEIGKS